MSKNLSKILEFNHLHQKLLQYCEDSFFEVHQGPPPFWNSSLDADLEVYLSQRPQFTYSICPICSHKLNGPEFPNDFDDPWWIYPQRGFNDQKPCSHLEIVSFSILWTHSEPLGAPWQIPCGWGVPALTDNLSQNDNLKMTIKASTLSNGATIFWIGLYNKKPNSPIQSDFWPLPILKAKTP